MIAEEMLRSKNLYPTLIAKGETKISRERLAELERIERAHAAYLRATQRMRSRVAAVNGFGEIRSDYRRGYSDALTDFARYIVEAEDG